MQTELNEDELNLMTLAQEYSDEGKARELLESLRWPNGPVCPHCKCDDVYKLTPKPPKPTRTKPRKVREGLYCCAACREQFTVTVGTIFEGSHIPISKWVMAWFLMCSSKKSISAHQLHRMLKITYKSAWFMAHRIRYAMGPDDDAAMLDGTVEVDETYVGGKGELRTKHARKTPVMALIQRGGNMRARVVPTVSIKTTKAVISECVDKSAVVNTDELSVYHNQLKAYAGHDTVNHSKKMYALRMPGTHRLAHINTCESFFSLLKRSVVGAWHHVSRPHLQKYADEVAFRWDHRKVSDGARFVRGIKSVEGKRLTYRQVV
jgi:transposase-like protein